MARIFAPTSFDASRLHPDLYRFLFEDLTDDVVVLLEFHVRQSRTAPKTREVDLAIAGPYGIDVIEVKDKRGVVVASQNGAWTVRDARGRSEKIPLNGERRENPYDQADANAATVRDWLANELRIECKAFPAVLVPGHQQRTNIPGRSFVFGYNGVRAMADGLRSLTPYKGTPPCWQFRQYLDLATSLDLTEVGFARIEGVVHDQRDRTRGVRKAKLSVLGIEAVTNRNGWFEFRRVPAGSHVIRVRAEPAFSEREVEVAVGSEELRLEIALQPIAGIGGDEAGSSTSASGGDAGPGRDDDRLAAMERMLQRLLDGLEGSADPKQPAPKANALASELRAMLEHERRERETFFELLTEQATAANTPNPVEVSDTRFGAALAEIQEQLLHITEALESKSIERDAPSDPRVLQAQLVLLSELRQEGPRLESLRTELVSVSRPPPARAPASAAKVINVAPAARQRSPKRVPMQRRPAWVTAAVVVGTAAIVAVVGLLRPDIMGAAVSLIPSGSTDIAAGTATTNLASVDDSELGRTTGGTAPALDDRTGQEVDPLLDADDGRLGGDAATAASDVPQSPPETSVPATTPAQQAATPVTEPAEPSTTPATTPTSAAAPATPLPGTPVAAVEATDAAPNLSLPGTPVSQTRTATSPGVAPTSFDACPDSHPIKGNVNRDGEQIFHLPSQEYYATTNPERCFATRADATAEGFRPSLR